jgi:hypothetical protein
MPEPIGIGYDYEVEIGLHESSLSTIQEVQSSSNALSLSNFESFSK